MNLEKADYGTIIEFGTPEDFDTKLRMDGHSFEDVVDYVDEAGITLLGKCLVTRKFDMAKRFLDKNARVNRVTKDGCNEFHLIAANIRYDGAIEIAKILLDRGVSLTAVDKKYGNTALFTLCMEIFAVRSPERMEFLEKCIEQADNVDHCNKAGISTRMMVAKRGTDRLKQLMEMKK